MMRKHVRFVKLLKQELKGDFVKFHFVLHQEGLCNKSLKHLQNVISVLTKMFNYIAAHALNKRTFRNLLKWGDIGLIMYNNVRWLSCGDILHRFAKLLKEVKLFLAKKHQIGYFQS